MPATTQIRVLIADGNPLYREGVRRLLEQEADFLVVGEAGTTPDAVRLAYELRPSVLLLDRSMPGADGPDTLRELAAMESQLCTILMTARVHQTDVLSALQFGARGVMAKDSDGEVLILGIRKVMAGEYWITRASVGDLINATRTLLVRAREAQPRKPRITPRQQEIIASVALGRSNRQIAEEFSLSEDTVKRHLTNIFGRVGVTNRMELALFAIQHELASAS
jgi:two-component system nitrate/nitrite response regulator NarL